MSKLSYYLREYVNLLCPVSLLRRRYSKLLEEAHQRPDWECIMDRVNYYNQMKGEVVLPSETIHELHEHHFVFLDQLKNYHRSTFHSAYYFDLMDVARAFDQETKIGYVPGDVYFNPSFPALVKSRVLKADRSNSVLLKLDKHRHFRFVKDDRGFTEKGDRAIFRGKIRSSRQRRQFMEIYFGSEVCDCGIVERLEEHPEWRTPRIGIREHLDYKYIMCLEGNDVATNLKWVMSSNSIAVMPRPTCETWFMEGRLVPGYHYIEIKDDLSDLEDRLRYYTLHLEKAQEIIDHAHEIVAQFMDEEREQIISLLVMEKYLKYCKS